jgi:hypothetical protein
MIVLHPHARVHGVVEDKGGAERSVPSVTVAQAGGMSRMSDGHPLSVMAHLRVEFTPPVQGKVGLAGLVHRPDVEAPDRSIRFHHAMTCHQMCWAGDWRSGRRHSIHARTHLTDRRGEGLTLTNLLAIGNPII